MTQRPDLFGTVICSFPLLDMLRYERFLVASLWISEYGSATDAEQFQYLRAYSPYHDVVPGTSYPAWASAALSRVAASALIAAASVSDGAPPCV